MSPFTPLVAKFFGTDLPDSGVKESVQNLKSRKVLAPKNIALGFIFHIPVDRLDLSWWSEKKILFLTWEVRTIITKVVIISGRFCISAPGS